MAGSKLRVALGGSALLAFLGGGARLAQVEVAHTDRQAEVASLRDRGAFREAEAAHAASLELELAEFRLSSGRGFEDLEAARGEVARLGEDLQALEQRWVAAEQAAAEALSAGREESERLLGEAESLRAQAQELAQRRAVAVAQLEQTLEAIRSELASRQAELLNERARTVSLQEDVRSRQEALDQRARELSEALAQLDGVEALLGGALTRAEQAERALTTLRAAGVNVDRLTGIDPMPDVRAKVVKVDTRASPPVLLVDVGSEAGIAVGDELFVFRDGREVARLEVDAVRDRLCSARLVRADRGLRLRPGDGVRSRPLQRK